MSASDLTVFLVFRHCTMIDTMLEIYILKWDEQLLEWQSEDPDELTLPLKQQKYKQNN